MIKFSIASAFYQGGRSKIRDEKTSFLNIGEEVMKKLSFRLAVLAAAVIFIQNLVFTSQANGNPWSNPSGSAADFNWVNGQSFIGLFGNPTLNGDGKTLDFSISNFRTECSDGASSSVSDTLEFELIAHPGLSFKSITIKEECDYQIFVSDEESGLGSVQATTTLSINNLDTSDVLGDFVIDSTLIESNSYIYAIWKPEATFNITQQDWTHIKITLRNDLQANTIGLGSNAWIEKEVFGTSIAIQMIPEPATITILSIGSLAFIRRKKINLSASGGQ